MGLARHERHDVQVLAAETLGAASFAAALQAGRPVRLDGITSIAKSLGALEVAAWPVAAIRRFPHQSVVLSDEQVLDAVVRYADDYRQLVEPACGVSLALAYQRHPSLAQARDVVIIVCGGVGVTPALVAQWAEAAAAVV